MSGPGAAWPRGGQGSSVGPTGSGTRVIWVEQDRLRVFSVLAVAGLVLAAAMARFGLPPADLHTPLHDMGYMDPLCGGTRATRYAAQGEFAESWRYNPLGLFVVAGASLLIVRLAIGLLVGRWMDFRLDASPMLRRWVILIAFVLVVVLEVRQQGRADLLMATRT